MATDDLTDDQFGILQDAITLARNRNVTSLDALKQMLSNCGHAMSDIEPAMKFWANHEARKKSYA